jgi:hypothetical protein
MPPAGDVSPGMLSVPVSLTPLQKRCRLSGVSQLQLHPPMRLFPTDRLPSVRFAALQTVLLAHYDFRQPVPRASFVTSRSVIRLVVFCSLTLAGLPPPTCRAFVQPICPQVRLSLPEDCRISQVPMKPLRLTELLPPGSHLRPALRPRSNRITSPLRLSQCCPQL